MAAIKAAQLGLKVSSAFCFWPFFKSVDSLSPDCMHREAWDPWRNVLERRLYSFEGHAQ